MLADLGVLEQLALHPRLQDRVVRPLLCVQRVLVHLGQCHGRVAEHRHVPGHRVGRVVGQPVVVPVVARERRGPRVCLQQGVDDALGERCELR